jgi:hypothetical protein
LAIGLWNAPRPGGPTPADSFFVTTGLLYVVFTGVQIVGGAFWRSFVIPVEIPNLPLNRLGLIGRCAVGGLLQLMAGAALAGVAVAIGATLRK